MEFEEKIEANSLDLSRDDEIASDPLMMLGIGDLPRFRTLLVIPRIRGTLVFLAQSWLGQIQHSLS